MDYRIAGCIAFELWVILVIVIAYGRTIRWLQRYQAQVMFVLMFPACEMTAFASAGSNVKKWLWSGIVIAVVFLLLYRVYKKNAGAVSQRKRWISLKSGEYKVETPVPDAPALQNIVTSSDVIRCYSTIPEDNMDIDVFVQEDPQGMLTCLYFTYKQKRPWTIRRFFYTAMRVLVCSCALILPFVYMWETEPYELVAEDSLTSGIVSLCFGGIGILFFKSGQGFFNKLLNAFSWLWFLTGLYVIFNVMK